MALSRASRTSASLLRDHAVLAILLLSIADNQYIIYRMIAMLMADEVTFKICSN